MTKPRELREMTAEQLQFALEQAKTDLFQLRVQSATEKLEAPSQMRKLRAEIARILTIQRQRELAGAAAQ